MVEVEGRTRRSHSNSDKAKVNETVEPSRGSELSAGTPLTDSVVGF